LVVIAGRESAPGFQLAGVDVFEVDENEKNIRRLLVDFINDDSIGIIAIEEDLAGAIDDQLRSRIDKLYRPVVIPIPSKKKIDTTDARTTYVRAIIKKAVGFDIKLGGK
jgi:V/A-type H+-transporting ATPase subunit F